MSRPNPNECYLLQIFLDTGFGVRLKPLLSSNVDSDPPYFHGKFARQVFTVCISRGNGGHSGPFVPLHQFSQRLTLVNIRGACAEEVRIVLFIW